MINSLGYGGAQITLCNFLQVGGIYLLSAIFQYTRVESEIFLLIGFLFLAIYNTTQYGVVPTSTFGFKLRIKIIASQLVLLYIPIAAIILACRYYHPLFVGLLLMSEYSIWPLCHLFYATIGTFDYAHLMSQTEALSERLKRSGRVFVVLFLCLFASISLLTHVMYDDTLVLASEAPSNSGSYAELLSAMSSSFPYTPSDLQDRITSMQEMVESSEYLKYSNYISSLRGAYSTDMPSAMEDWTTIKALNNTMSVPLLSAVSPFPYLVDISSELYKSHLPRALHLVPPSSILDGGSSPHSNHNSNSASNGKHGHLQAVSPGPSPAHQQAFLPWVNNPPLHVLLLVLTGLAPLCFHSYILFIRNLFARSESLHDHRISTTFSLRRKEFLSKILRLHSFSAWLMVFFLAASVLIQSGESAPISPGIDLSSTVFNLFTSGFSHVLNFSLSTGADGDIVTASFRGLPDASYGLCGITATIVTSIVLCSFLQQVWFNILLTSKSHPAATFPTTSMVVGGNGGQHTSQQQQSGEAQDQPVDQSEAAMLPSQQSSSSHTLQAPKQLSSKYSNFYYFVSLLTLLKFTIPLTCILLFECMHVYSTLLSWIQSLLQTSTSLNLPEADISSFVSMIYSKYDALIPFEHFHLPLHAPKLINTISQLRQQPAISSQAFTGLLHFLRLAFSLTSHNSLQSNDTSPHTRSLNLLQWLRAVPTRSICTLLPCVIPTGLVQGVGDIQGSITGDGEHIPVRVLTSITPMYTLHYSYWCLLSLGAVFLSVFYSQQSNWLSTLYFYKARLTRVLSNPTKTGFIHLWCLYFLSVLTMVVLRLVYFVLTGCGITLLIDNAKCSVCSMLGISQEKSVQHSPMSMTMLNTNSSRTRDTTHHQLQDHYPPEIFPDVEVRQTIYHHFHHFHQFYMTQLHAHRRPIRNINHQNSNSYHQSPHQHQAQPSTLYDNFIADYYHDAKSFLYYCHLLSSKQSHHESTTGATNNQIHPHQTYRGDVSDVHNGDAVTPPYPMDTHKPPQEDCFRVALCCHSLSSFGIIHDIYAYHGVLICYLFLIESLLKLVLWVTTAVYDRYTLLCGGDSSGRQQYQRINNTHDDGDDHGLLSPEPSLRASSSSSSTILKASHASGYQMKDDRTHTSDTSIMSPIMVISSSNTMQSIDVPSINSNITHIAGDGALPALPSLSSTPFALPSGGSVTRTRQGSIPVSIARCNSEFCHVICQRSSATLDRFYDDDDDDDHGEGNAQIISLHGLHNDPLHHSVGYNDDHNHDDGDNDDSSDDADEHEKILLEQRKNYFLQYVSLPSLFTHVVLFLTFLTRKRSLWPVSIYLAILLTVMVLEFIYGVYSGSLGLVADAFHMLFDSFGISIGLVADYLRDDVGGNHHFTYGYTLIDSIAGNLSATLLLCSGLYIVGEAIGRLLNPVQVHTHAMLPVVCLGLLVNVIGVVAFHHAHSHGPPGHECEHSHSHGGSAPKKTSTKETDAVSSPNPASTNESAAADGLLESSSTQSSSPSESASSWLDYCYNCISFRGIMEVLKIENISLAHWGVFLHLMADLLGSITLLISALLTTVFGMQRSDGLVSLFISFLIIGSILPLYSATIDQMLFFASPSTSNGHGHGHGHGHSHSHDHGHSHSNGCNHGDHPHHDHGHSCGDHHNHDHTHESRSASISHRQHDHLTSSTTNNDSLDAFDDESFNHLTPTPYEQSLLTEAFPEVTLDHATIYYIVQLSIAKYYHMLNTNRHLGVPHSAFNAMEAQSHSYLSDKGHPQPVLKHIIYGQTFRMNFVDIKIILSSDRSDDGIEHMGPTAGVDDFNQSVLSTHQQQHQEQHVHTGKEDHYILSPPEPSSAWSNATFYSTLAKVMVPQIVLTMMRHYYHDDTSLEVFVDFECDHHHCGTY